MFIGVIFLVMYKFLGWFRQMIYPREINVLFNDFDSMLLSSLNIFHVILIFLHILLGEKLRRVFNRTTYL